MKILRLLNKINLSILLTLFLIQNSFSEEAVDIWNLEKENKEIKIENDIILDPNESLEDSIYETQDERKNKIEIKEESNFASQDSNVNGIYDPSENGLSINMWVNSNGSQILKIFEKINKIKLSEDASHILNIALLTNSYLPKKNISKSEFLEIKSNWLIKNKDFNIIKIYLNKNNNLLEESKLITFYADYYLSISDLSKVCEIFDKINTSNFDNYVSKYYIYCLINSEKKEEAQLIYDLLIESGFEDNFFDRQFSYLMEYEKNQDNKISQKTLLDFHLSHRTNLEFNFEPNENTQKLIWKYLSSSNLLESVELVDLEDKQKIITIEKATHDKNYKEDELFSLYERFMFNINQLLNIKEAYKLLPNSEARALIYQGILLNKESSERIELIKLLKDLFNEDGISRAFELKLSEFLKKIDSNDIPSNYTSFYESNLKTNIKNIKKIKINNKIIHQSKLLNYFIKNTDIKTAQKDLENLFKKIKKDKNYFVSIKDVILIESLKSDGVRIPKKYEKFYQSVEPDIPYDIQILINKDELGLALLRLVEIIGEDKVTDIGYETIYFIVSILNQLNLDKIRNEILLKVLPLKV